MKEPTYPHTVVQCPACQTRRQHTDEERQLHHPLSGHGFVRECGWSSLDAELEHLRDRERLRHGA